MADWGYGLAGTAIGWFVGLLQAGAQQDREKLLRYRGVARALRAEVGRIAVEMGDRERGPLFTRLHGTTPKVPGIHEALKPLMTEAAGADSLVLTRFLDLERELQNLGVFDAVLQRLEEAKAEAHAKVEEGHAKQLEREAVVELPELDLLEGTLPEPEMLSQADMEAMLRGLESAGALLTLEYTEEKIADRINDVNFSQMIGRGRIWKELDLLLARLAALADLELPSLLGFTLHRAVPYLPEYPPPDWVVYARGEVPKRLAASDEIIEEGAHRSALLQRKKFSENDERRERRRSLNQ